MQYELVTLISEGLRRGIDRTTIVETLEKKGWDKRQIEATLASFETTTTGALPEALALILQHPIVVLMAFSIAFFAFFGQNFSSFALLTQGTSADTLLKAQSVSAAEQAAPFLLGFSISTATTSVEQKSTDVRVRGVSANRYMVADLDGDIVYAHKGDADGAPIASLTKLMTALIAAEYIPLTEDLMVPKAALVGTTIRRLRAGQEINAYQLLFPLLMESSNEAAETFAARLGRSWFIDRMNSKAKELGMQSTQFADPAGLDAGNVSSVEDLLTLARYISEHKSFILKITAGDIGETEYGKPEMRNLRNFNDFQGKDGFVGGKIGNTDEAKQTGMFLFDLIKDGYTHRVVIILLGSENQKQDAQTLLQFVKRKYF